MPDKFNQDRLNDLKDEMKISEGLNKEELEPIIVESLQRYLGEYIPPQGAGWDIILNEVYPIIQNELPSIFFRNPRAFLKPRNKTYLAKRRNLQTQKMEEVQLDSTKSARTQESILNYKVSQINYKQEARKTLQDALLFPYGVMWHGYKGDFGMTDEQSFFIRNEDIFVKRIMPLRFIHDPTVGMSNIDEARWTGRIIDIPIEDILQDKLLDVDKSKIKGFQGFGDKISSRARDLFRGSSGKDSSRPSRSLLDFADQRFKKSNASRFLRVQEVYVRPNKKERQNGEKGWILLLTEDQDKPLRADRWNIKAEGSPGKILQFNEVCDRAFGLSDIDAYKGVADHKNAIKNIQLRNAQEHTKVWVGLDTEGVEEEDIEMVRQGQSTIILFKGDKPVSQKMMVASPGGAASSELYLIDQRIQRELEDKSGVTDLKRGFLQSGEESAASVKLRAAGGGARPAYRQDIMSDFLKESFLYLNQLNKQFMTVNDAVRVVGSLDIEWSENPTKEELQADVDVEIDVISMLPENPAKEMDELTKTLALMIDAVRDPAIANKLAQEGKTLNLSPIIEQMLLRLRINNPDIFRNIKAEESMGFVSVRQVREAKANVEAAISGQNVPFPPNEEDDHRAKLEVYTTVTGLLEAAGQVSEVLQNLVQVHTALIQQLQSKQASPGQQVKLSKPGVTTF